MYRTFQYKRRLGATFKKQIQNGQIGDKTCSGSIRLIVASWYKIGIHRGILGSYGKPIIKRLRGRGLSYGIGGVQCSTKIGSEFQTDINIRQPEQGLQHLKVIVKKEGPRPFVERSYLWGEVIEKGRSPISCTNGLPMIVLPMPMIRNPHLSYRTGGGSSRSNRNTQRLHPLGCSNMTTRPIGLLNIVLMRFQLHKRRSKQFAEILHRGGVSCRKKHLLKKIGQCSEGQIKTPCTSLSDTIPMCRESGPLETLSANIQ